MNLVGLGKELTFLEPIPDWKLRFYSEGRREGEEMEEREGLTSSDLQELKTLHSKLLHLSYQQDQTHFLINRFQGFKFSELVYLI